MPNVNVFLKSCSSATLVRLNPGCDNSASSSLISTGLQNLADVVQVGVARTPSGLVLKVSSIFSPESAAGTIGTVACPQQAEAVIK